MFGIGLPEMIVILAVALIVVGPDKLPELARSLAKGAVELKRTMNQLKNNLTEEGDLDSLKSELEDTGKDIKDQLIDSDFQTWQPDKNFKKNLLKVEPTKTRPWETEQKKINPAAKEPASPEVVDIDNTDKPEDESQPRETDK